MHSAACLCQWLNRCVHACSVYDCNTAYRHCCAIALPCHAAGPLSSSLSLVLAAPAAELPPRLDCPDW